MQDVELEKFHRIERNNLIHLLKLSVKNLIDYALSLNCGLEEEEAPLYQLFVVLEKILQHGLKEKNSLFSSRSADFFGVIEILKTELDWSEDLIKSVNNMSQLKTVVGRGRAFLRLAMMQKKVHLLLLCLVDNEEKLREHYHTHALLLAEEAHIISGLLVGLNVIDCNLCLKERDLDNLPQVIQLVVYLKEGNYLHSPTPPPSPQLGKLGTKQDYQNILEQKSYIEEINEKLKLDSQANEAKNKILRSDNSSLSTKMKELEQELTSLVTERDILQKNINESESAYRKRIEVEKADIAIERSTYEASRNGLNELYLMAKEELVASNHKIIELEKDFEVLKKVKADCEEAMNLLDKDIHDKDDTIAALRKQCAEVKKLNLNMLGRVQSTEVAMCEKDSSLRQAEGRQSTASSQVTELTKQLETMTEQLEKTALELDEYKKKCYETEVKFEQVQTQYHVEKEWREQIQSQSIKDREDVARLRAELTHISEIKSTLKQVQRENEDLRRSCSEQERALIELGDHLSKSKERAEELKITTDVMKESKWTDDKDIENCQQCNKTFSVARRRHHCRNCGGIFCHQCSDNTMPLPSSARPLRVCDRCNDLLIQRYQAA